PVPVTVKAISVARIAADHRMRKSPLNEHPRPLTRSQPENQRCDESSKQTTLNFSQSQKLNLPPSLLALAERWRCRTSVLALNAHCNRYLISTFGRVSLMMTSSPGKKFEKGTSSRSNTPLCDTHHSGEASAFLV